MKGAGGLFVRNVLYAGTYQLEPHFGPTIAGRRKAVTGYAGIFTPTSDLPVSFFVSASLLLANGRVLRVPAGRRVANGFEIEVVS